MTPITDHQRPADSGEASVGDLRPDGGEELLGPVQVAERLGVKPQLIINWIREGRAHPTAVDGVGRLRFTNRDVDELRAGLGRRRGGRETEGAPPTAGE